VNNYARLRLLSAVRPTLALMAGLALAPATLAQDGPAPAPATPAQDSPTLAQAAPAQDSPTLAPAAPAQDSPAPAPAAPVPESPAPAPAAPVQPAAVVQTPAAPSAAEPAPLPPLPASAPLASASAAAPTAIIPAGPPRQSPIVTAEEAGFGISSRDGAYQVRIHGQLQVDGRAFFANPALRESDTFLVRRARPTIEVTLAGLADALITPDFAGGTAQLYDAYIDLHPLPWLRLRAGKFKPPVGLERLQSDNNLVFTERALDQDLTAQRDIGAQLWGDAAGGILRYEAAILNGVPDSGLNDTGGAFSKSLAGRLFVQPFALPPLRGLGRLGVGFAAETGDETGSSAITGGAATGTWLPTYKSIGQNTIFSYLTSTTDPTQNVIALNRHTRLNPQIYYYYGPAGLEAEYLFESQGVAKNGVATELHNSAGHLTLAYVIGGNCSYEGPRVKKPFSLATGTLGALELGARYSRLAIDSAAFPALADPTKSITTANAFGFALNWYLTQSLRVAVTYDQTTFDGGAKSGTITADRTGEKVLIARLQVGY